MPLEVGGRADKMGNRYEIKCIIYELLKVFREENYSVVVEAIGDDEIGTDILVTNFDGVKEHQQCKVRNASKEHWSIADLISRNILKKWKKQLQRDDKRNVALVSPIECVNIVDLHDRAINTNDNPADFYAYQIESCSKEFYNFYKDFCEEMGLNIDESADIARSIDYLKRINCKQISEYTLREIISQEINYIFVTDWKTVYNALVTLLIDGDIYGKEITAFVLREYLSKQNIHMRMFDGDRRIIPQIERVNKEYRNSFKPLKEGLIDRTEFKECIAAINNEQSFIISGNAGYGKSGCTEAILNYCENEGIPHIALKLDRRIPHGNSELWGKELGFSSSIVYALNAISKGSIAVLILDQLDALRWTQANSSEALAVCMEMIRQVSYLNSMREKKIVIVFVCREYDLRNDNNIKSLFEKEGDDNRQIEWMKVIVNDLDENVVKRVVGDNYERLTLKTRRLLQVPCNLYIWQHLDGNGNYDDCTTTSHLIETWFQQICRKCNNVGVDEKVVGDTVKCIVNKLDEIGRLYVPKRILDVNERGLDYLVYSEILVVDGQKVGFVHQSILDYFISNRMAQQYYGRENIEQIVGEKNKQTPSKRYQVQMFLQNLLECDSGDFLSAGTQMIASSQIRYYVKYVFYEILRQIPEPDAKIVEYIKSECKDEHRREYIINNVVSGRHPYITILREDGILEQWFSDEKKKRTVFVLLNSISPDLDTDDIAFIKQHALINEEDDKQFMGCFWHDVIKESDELFELRMSFYNKYPIWSQELYIDINSMMEHCEIRIIKLISFWLKNKILSKGKNVYHYEEQLINENDSYLLKNGKFVLDELVQYIPLQGAGELYNSDWSGRYLHHRGLERAAVELLKKANIAIISTEPEYFWQYYSVYMGKNYAIFNEIILHGMRFLPQSYSDQVITYLSKDLDKKVFDFTSGTEDQLGLVKKVIMIHAVWCNEECLNSFVETIERYVSPKAVDWYKRRIDFNKQRECPRVYWSYWGELQYHLLKCIPYERLSSKQQDLLKVLDRKFQGNADRYIDRNGHSGYVQSPVSGKQIGKKQWLQIITNPKILDRTYSNWKEVAGGFVESSLEMYVSDFQSAVKNSPKEIIKMVIEHKTEVLPAYIDAMYAGAEYSDFIDQIDQKLWEQMFRVFPCDMKSQRAIYFCGIIEKTKIYTWSENVISKLKEIALNYEGGEEEQQLKNRTEMNSKELISKSLNCAKGHAVSAIGNLLWDNKNLLADFKETIDKLTLDKDAVVRMACFYALWPIYNIDREWAESRILRVYESDIRMAGFQDSKNMFLRLYSKFKERILLIIKRCFGTDDKILMQVGGYSICELYIQYNEFEEIMSNMDRLSEEQVKAILQMAILYLEYDEYREKSKEIILKYKNSDSDVEFPLGNMFLDNHVDVERDAEFLMMIMKSKVSKRMVYSFVRYLEKNACSVKDYAEVIITLCENVLSMSQEELASYWGIENDISKLIIALYDQTANSDSESSEKVAEKCLELWDVMFEKQIGQVRVLSRMLMER